MTAALYDAPSGEADPGLPGVKVADPLDDTCWFGSDRDHFRARRAPGGVWLVRKRGDVFLRVFTKSTAAISDRDHELSAAWYIAAHPDWALEWVQKAARKALRK
jgi:hypothetical protein